MSDEKVKAKTRREFLAGASVSVVGLGVAMGQANTPGAPPAFGTAPAVGPEVTAATFAEAEQLMQITLTGEDRAEAAGNWRQSMAALYERRVGPRKVTIPEGVAPYSSLSPVRAAAKAPSAMISASDVLVSMPKLPASDAEIAFAPVGTLSLWIQARKIRPNG